MMDELIEWWSGLPDIRIGKYWIGFAATGTWCNIRHWRINLEFQGFCIHFLGMILRINKRKRQFFTISEILY